MNRRLLGPFDASGWNLLDYSGLFFSFERYKGLTDDQKSKAVDDEDTRCVLNALLCIYKVHPLVVDASGRTGTSVGFPLYSLDRLGAEVYMQVHHTKEAVHNLANQLKGLEGYMQKTRSNGMD